jgi:hypothetical protein
MRLAVAAKIAFVTAGATAAVGASPKPPGGSEFLTRYVSTAGALRSNWPQVLDRAPCLTGDSPVARDCVVELVGLEPTTRVLWNVGVSDQLTLSDTTTRQAVLCRGGDRRRDLDGRERPRFWCPTRVAGRTPTKAPCIRTPGKAAKTTRCPEILDGHERPKHRCPTR